METGNKLQGEVAESAVERRLRIWRGLAVAFGAALAALTFAAYTRPELLLNFTGLRYCG